MNRQVQFGCCLSVLLTLSASVNGQDDPKWIDAAVPESTADLQRLQSEVQCAVQKSLPAVVSIVTQVDPPKSEVRHFEPGASGVIISADGLVLSQAHVSHLSGELSEETGLIEARQPGDVLGVILHDGRRMRARLLGADYDWDLSMLQIIDPGEYPHLALSDQKVLLGQWALKLGHPHGYREDRGTVVRLGRVLYAGRSTMVADCQTTGGDSGGPLIDLEGKLIGLIYSRRQPKQLQDAVIRELPNLHSLMSYVSLQVITPRIPAMKKSGVVRRRDFSQHQMLLAEQADAREFLSMDTSTHGKSLHSAWLDITADSKSCVVEILRQGVRVAFGTVVGNDGLIVTKASEIDAAPQCRISNGEVLVADLVKANASYDLAFLRISRQLRPVTWSKLEPKSRGRFLMTPDLAGKPLAWGIVSVSKNRRDAQPPTEIHREPVRSDQSLPYRDYRHALAANFRCDDFPIAFEHDLPLLADQCGGPLFDLNGNVPGITIARAGYHGCIAAPASVIRQLCESIRLE